MQYAFYGMLCAFFLAILIYWAWKDVKDTFDKYGTPNPGDSMFDFHDDSSPE